MIRLSSGGQIDRSRPISFRFNGKLMTGFHGDTLASALLANGVTIFGRSFKYHRPRGVMTDGADEPNALVTLHAGARSEPNTKAPIVEIFDGLEARSQNCWPTPSFDLMAVIGLFAPLLIGGFYYKTFMWPAAFWERVYEPLIRRAAGLGRLSGLPDPDHYDRSHAFAELLVVGSGIAGLNAAREASRQGRRVLLVEADRDLGGRILSENRVIEGQRGADWVAWVKRELEESANVQILTRTTLFGAYDGGTYAAIERVADHLAVAGPGQPRQRYWKIAAAEAIMAPGATERPIAFGGNDRPGIMMASAVQTYVNRYAVAPGTCAVIFAICDSGYQVAADLVAAGVKVRAIVDGRPGVSPPVTNLRVISGEITGTHGKTLRAIDVRSFSGSAERISCDLLAVAGGWNPNIGFASHLGVRPEWCDTRQAFRQNVLPQGMIFAGAADGAQSFETARVNGIAAAHRGTTDDHASAGGSLSVEVGAPPLVVENTRGKVFVDFQHDVTVADVLIAENEGFKSVEHLNRYTTLGMATDQGKAGQVLAHALLAKRRNVPVGAVGTIATRPPHTPIAIGALAGMHRGIHLKPVRETPSHQWAREQNASFVNAGLWKRPQWFSRPDDTDWLASATREAKAVRAAVGLCDVSTLGKIEVAGPDAATLLDLLYTNIMSSLPVGKCRYGLMLREDGFVFDDGTVARLSDERFVLTTTTVNAVAVMRHIDFVTQVVWPELDVQTCSVTENWAQFAVAGPRSRELLQHVLPDVELSNDALPFMGVVTGEWERRPMRLFRMSFSGELAYEIAVPARNGDALIRKLSAAGREQNCTPYGLEALAVLRIEKGHAAGAELNGQVTAHDLGLARMLSKKKDFIGRAMAERPALVAPERQTLIGLKPVNPMDRLSGGSHLICRGARASADADEGHVTSVCFSGVFDQWIALGYLASGQNRTGEIVSVVSPLRGTRFDAEVCSSVFFDPSGERLRG